MTVEEVLKQSGMSDEQIKSLDANAVKGFTTILSTATTAHQQAQERAEAAERAERAQKQMYQTDIAPALDNWATEKSNMEATVAFYRTQAEEAKKNGFIAKDAPGYVPPNPTTPGSPVRDPETGKYMTAEQGLTALSNATWAMTEYTRLFNEPMPDEFMSVLREATDARMPFRDYASQKYGFEAKRQAIQETKQKERDDKIRQEAVDSTKREMAEKYGSNPMTRVAAASQFAEVSKATQEGKRKDPLTMSREERHRSTAANINQELASNAVH